MGNFLSSGSYAHQSQALATVDLTSVTTQAVDVFLASKDNNGMINGIDYWQVANAYTAIALHDNWSGNYSHVHFLKDAVATVGNTNPSYLREYNDDSMWWALTLLDLFELTNNSTMVSIARTIWQHVDDHRISSNNIIVHGQNMDGAVYWRTEGTEAQTGQVNSVTTGLFAELSARLALHGSDPEQSRMIELSNSSLQWILRTCYNESEHVVLDTINVKTDEVVDWALTYDTGQTIAAAVALYETFEAFPNQSISSVDPLGIACTLAQAAMIRPDWINENGILDGREWPGDKSPDKRDDGVGFKSVLVRSLAKLYRVLHRNQLQQALQTDIESFIRRQYDSNRNNNTNDQGQYGPLWTGPFEVPTSHSQMAVLDVMAAMHAIS